MAKLISMTYEQARAEHFKALKDEAKRKMNYWATRVRRCSPNYLNDPAHIKASEYGTEYSYYKDALEALEDNRFQYETGFVKGFESAQPKWFSVEERLTEPHDDGSVDAVLVTDDLFVHMAYFNQGIWHFCESGEMKEPMFYMVKHWMLLPEPPKEDA